MLKGTICCQDGSTQPFDRCMGCARAGQCDHSLPLLTFMQKNQESRQGVGYSSSVLNGCPRQHILKQNVDYWESPKDFYARWRGSWGHHAVDMTGPYPGIVQEVRFRRNVTVDGVTFDVSGKPDWIDPEEQEIQDHKTIAFIPKAPYDDHKRQINIYAWLVETGECDQPGIGPYLISRARMHYLAGKNEAFMDVDLWSHDAVEEYVVNRLRPFAAHVLNGTLPGKLGESEKWKAAYCPFKGSGKCCMEQDDD